MPSTLDSQRQAAEPASSSVGAVDLDRDSLLGRVGNTAATWFGRPVTKVLIAVAGWSLVVQLVALLGTQYFNTLAHPGVSALPAAWMHWDAVFFQRIVAYGYWGHPGSQEGPGVLLRAAFYPGYPLLARGVYELLHPFGIGITGAMLAANQLLVFPMAVLVYLMGARLTGSREIGQRTVHALLLFPFAYFLLAPYSEASFLTCVAGFCWALTARRYWVAAAFAAAAGATRPLGLVLAGILVVGYLEEHRWRLRSLTVRPFLYLAVSVSGFVAWTTYQWARTGTPLYAERMERIGWHRSFTPNLLHAIKYAFEPQPLTAGPFRSVPVEAITMIGLLVAFGLLSWIVWRRFGVALGLMCAVFLLLSLATGTLFSFNRYVLPLLPAFVVLGGWTARWRTFDFIYKTAGAMLLTLFLVLYTHAVWTG